VRAQDEPIGRTAVQMGQDVVKGGFEGGLVDVGREEDGAELDDGGGGDVGEGLAEGDGVVVGLDERVGGVD